MQIDYDDVENFCLIDIIWHVSHMQQSIVLGHGALVY